MKFALFLGIVILFPTTANSEPSTERLAEAINEWRGGLIWWECGSPMDGESGLIRAREYASKILDVSTRYKHQPVVLAAILEQESGYDECQVGGPSRKRLGLRVHPSRESVVAASRSRSKMDLGAAQFLWPRGSPYGITDGVPVTDVITMGWSVEALGKTLSLHREQRPAQSSAILGGRLLRHEHIYWVLHNSPMAYNETYYLRVRSRAIRLWRSLS